MTKLSFAWALICGSLLALASCTDTNGPMEPEGERTLKGASNPVGPLALPTQTDTDGDGLFDSIEETLLRQYRPYWDFDPQDRNWPIAVENWATFGGTVYNSNGSNPKPYNSVATLLTAVQQNPTGHMATNTNAILSLDYGAPTYMDAVPVSGCYNSKCDWVWLHYYLFWHADSKDAVIGTPEHWGDWEHMCVLASKSSSGNKFAYPGLMHWHHHGSATLSSTAFRSYADPACSDPSVGYNHSNCWGTRHPAAFVQALSHGIYRDAGGDHRGGGHIDNHLDNPFYFMVRHYTNSTRSIDEIITTFDGRWGQTHQSYPEPVPDNYSPLSPLVFNSRCDHDYLSPTKGTGTPTISLFQFYNLGC